MFAFFRFEIEVLSPNNPLRARIINEVMLDREEREMYQLQLVATDNATVPLSSSVPVTIVVTDVNDNPPVFNMSTLNVVAAEDLSLNSVISEISVSNLLALKIR